MAGINTAGRPTLSQRRSRMSQLGEEELDNLAFRPNIVPSLSSGRNDSIASQTESEVELNKRSRVVPEPGPPPNGGLKAWQQVLGAFFLNFNTWCDSLGIICCAEYCDETDYRKLGVLSIPSVSSKITTPLALSSQLLNRRSPGSAQSKGS